MVRFRGTGVLHLPSNKVNQRRDVNFHVVLSSAMEGVILCASLRSIIGIRGLRVLGFRLERLGSTNLNCGQRTLCCR